MHDRSHRKVIAIAAPIGGGKSALVTALASALKDSVTLRFDDYENATRQSVDALAKWLAEGADFNQLQAPGLADDLAILRKGDAINARDGVSIVAGTQDLIFEMPLGRAWSATTDNIDLLVWVDVPLDIALARRIREVSADMLRQDAASAKRGLAWLNDYLGHYIATIHAVLEAQRRTVRAQADLIVDGTQPIASIVQSVLDHIAQSPTVAR